jgi:hypothetical protein
LTTNEAFSSGTSGSREIRVLAAQDFLDQLARGGVPAPEIVVDVDHLDVLLAGAGDQRGDVRHGLTCAVEELLGVLEVVCVDHVDDE